MPANAPESVPAKSIRRRKRARACRARSQTWTPSAERTSQPSGWTPRLPTDDWPRRYSRTAHAFLVASCPFPLRVFRFASRLTRDENGLAPLRGLQRVIGLGVRRKSSFVHIITVFADGFGNYFSDVGILPRKLRSLPESEAKQIVNDENLPIAVRAGADADRWDAQFARNLRRQLARHSFQHNRKSPGRFHRARVANQLLGGVRCFSLHAVPAQGVHRLRRQANVPHDRDFSFRQPRDQLQPAFPPFPFPSFPAAFFSEPLGFCRGLRLFLGLLPEGLAPTKNAPRRPPRPA